MTIYSAEKKYVIVPVMKKEKYLFPKVEQAQIAFVGRSNVGKSSVINALTSIPNLAHTSRNPGKTRHLNYYLLNNSLFFIDLPGYGYAEVSSKVRKRWGNLIEQYLTSQKNLFLCILVLDIRHKLTPIDQIMIGWFENYRIPYLVLLNKIDKLSKNNAIKQTKYYKETLTNINFCKSVIPFSAVTSQGKVEVWKTIDILLKKLN